MIGILFLSLALAMDAFAVSLVRGAAGPHSVRHALQTGGAFGIAQGVMPLLGWLLGILFIDWIAAFDHWIAFGLLSFLGYRMLRDGQEGDGTGGDDDSADEGAAVAGSVLWGLAIAAFATSIDAAAAGLTLDLFGLPVLLSCAVIGLVTMALCTPAYWFAARIGQSLGSKAEIFGGVVLIALGLKILLEHTDVI